MFFCCWNLFFAVQVIVVNINVCFLKTEIFAMLQTCKFRNASPLIKPKAFNILGIIFELLIIVRILLLLIAFYGEVQIPGLLVHVTDKSLNIYIIAYTMYLIQMTPVGYHVITFYQMMSDVMGFFLILFVIQISFADVFYRIIREDGNIEDVPDFSSAFKSVYGTLKLVMSMTSFGNVGNPLLLVIHLFFIVFVSIMLLNLVIAVFSQSVSQIYLYKDHLVMFQKNLTTCDLTMTRFSLIPKSLYQRQVKKHFAFEGNKLYIVVMKRE